MTPQWYKDAMAELGVKEILGPEQNARINEYQTAAGYNAQDELIPWCGSFISWIMRKNGIPYRFNTAAAAADWAHWGKALKSPVTGAVMVFPHHVTLFSSWVDDSHTVFWGLGGNQGGKAQDGGGVTLSKYDVRKCIAIRWPEKVPTPTIIKNPINLPVVKGAIAVAAGVVPIVAENSGEIVGGLGKAQTQFSAGTYIGAIAGTVVLIATAYIIISAVRKQQLDKKYSNPPKGAEDDSPEVLVQPTP